MLAQVSTDANDKFFSSGGALFPQIRAPILSRNQRPRGSYFLATTSSRKPVLILVKSPFPSETNLLVVIPTSSLIKRLLGKNGLGLTYWGVQ